jgi:hypothetical protein
MTVSNISVTCVDVSPGAEMNCKADVQMTIPTLITTGKLSVGVGITANTFILATIENVPMTPPGALSAQTRSQRFGGGCIDGVTSRAVQVYDGNYPSRQINGGRPLFVESVPTTMSCTPLLASR